MREGPHVAIEEADLILALVDPRARSRPEYISRIKKSHALRRVPPASTSTSKKSTSASHRADT
jgi:hypothetical protein